MKVCSRQLSAILSMLFVIAMLAACGKEADIRPDYAATSPLSDAVQVEESESAKTWRSAKDAEPQLPGMEPAIESDSLRLYMNRSTAEMAVVDKYSGQVWYSNPPEPQTDQLSPYLAGKLLSQVSLVYLTHNGQTQEYDSYNDSVKHGQFEIEYADTHVTVTYRFGDPEKGIDSLPAKLSKQRFEEKLLQQLEDTDDQEQLLSRYRFNEAEQIYERREIPKVVVNKIVALFEKAGYTEEDLAYDQAEHGQDGGSGGSKPQYAVTLEYRLEGDQLVAFIDTRAIEGVSPHSRLHSIGLLDYFGAAGEQDEGYIFLPDGSGAIIDLNSPKSSGQPIMLSLYGEDQAISAEEKSTYLEASRMPVFGMKRQDAALFAIIEAGDGIARLAADVAGRLFPYHTVSAQFVVMPRDSIQLSRTEEMIKTPAQMYQGRLQVRYTLLNGDDADYSGMAAYYRSYLTQRYGLQKLDADSDTPFYLELVGGIMKEKNMLGFPYEALVPLTTAAQTTQLIDQLNERQVANIHVNFKGWFSGGLLHGFPAKIRLEQSVGSLDQWQKIDERLQRSGGALYPDVALAKVYRSSGGFSVSKQAAQYMSRKYTKIYPYNLATYRKDHHLPSYYLLSPNALEDVVGRFLKQYGKLELGAVSLRDLGSDLYSDFRRNGEVTREAAKHIVTEQVKRIGEQTGSVMVSGGNVYLLPYVKHILNAPQQSNAFQLASESVPFYQMVLHGYVDYAGKPFNVADDQNLRTNVLQAIEQSSSVYYSLIYEKPSILQDTHHDDLNSHYYEHWLDEAATAYAEVNNVLKAVRGQQMIRHRKRADGIYRMDYENGKFIIVNYGGSDAVIDGMTVKAGHYAVGG
ncbi:DUF5696 domain-containing protein [Paenibacillus sp. J2TS4]|uniref:DUF5696 domain-containing protein n=1 Tax=Paenibacillus sp. J2TS4 TaxID=2807194 RepID=UPI001B1C5E59|nr:DUF5696 domain-containing protein [Paenibacillus sp. J2TS4]GIP34499.1 hypothetical protein J2TS4_37090 [Paenibacillus sp. J2TS4]